MYRKILVGYDGREPGRDALALAASLRAPDGVVIAACVYPGSGRVGSESVETLLADAASQTVAEAHAQADGGDWLELRAVPGHSLRTDCTSSAKRLRRTWSWWAQQIALSAAVCRLEGRRTTAERSPCPVAIAPAGFAAQAGSPRVIGVAYDGSEGSEIALLEAAALAAEFEASVKVITAVPPIELDWSAEAFAGTIASGDTIREQRRNGFRHMLEEAAERLPAEARAATVLRDGRPADGNRRRGREGDPSPRDGLAELRADPPGDGREHSHRAHASRPVPRARAPSRSVRGHRRGRGVRRHDNRVTRVARAPRVRRRTPRRLDRSPARRAPPPRLRSGLGPPSVVCTGAGGGGSWMSTRP